MSQMTATEARAALPELLDRVLAGAEVTITRHGRPVAVLVHPDRLRLRRAESVLAEAEALHEVLAAARTTPKDGVLSAQRAEELVRAVRIARDG